MRTMTVKEFADWTCASDITGWEHSNHGAEDAPTMIFEADADDVLTTEFLDGYSVDDEYYYFFDDDGKKTRVPRDADSLVWYWIGELSTDGVEYKANYHAGLFTSKAEAEKYLERENS